MAKFDALPSGVDPLAYYTFGAVRPSPGDPRDFRLKLAAPPAALPPRASVSGVVQAHNQQLKGSCMVFTGMQLLEHELAKAGVVFSGSEEFEYARQRELTNELCQNVGCVPRSVMNALTSEGTIDEASRPYTADLCTGTTQAERERAKLVHATSYRVCGDLDTVKAAIVADHKVAACFNLYETFIPDTNGVIPAPAGKLLGGHAMKFIGYDDALFSGGFWTENQWSAAWGRGGVCFIPYTICNLPAEHGGLWLGDTWTFDGALVEPQPAPPSAVQVFAERWFPQADGTWATETVALDGPTGSGCYYNLRTTKADGSEDRPGGFQWVGA